MEFRPLREGFIYEEIVSEERVTITRTRQIVCQELQLRSVDSETEHAKLQLERMIQVAAGDVTAVRPYLKVLDRLDRYRR